MIDLRSDTVTRPTDGMRRAAAEAAVGDDVYGEDPTVNDLETTAAELVGKESALFVPSGTMGNQVAALTHTTPGESVILERESHIYGWEGGGLAATAGLQVTALDGGATGLFDPDQVRRNVIEPSLHQAATGLLCVENTHNHAGGVAHHPEEVHRVASVATEHEIPVHLDGARLFNAAVALDLDPAAVAAPADSVMFCLSKGLGAPVGSMLAGPTAFIDEARRHRKRLGGGMRQAGIIAGPGLEALADWERLEADHRRAARLASALADLPDLDVATPETNIVLVDVAATGRTPGQFLAECEAAGVQGVAFGETVVRFCTHRDVDDADIDEAITAIASVLEG